MFVPEEKLPIIRIRSNAEGLKMLEKYATIRQIQEKFQVSIRTAYRYSSLMKRILVFDEMRSLSFLVVPRAALKHFKRPRRGNPYWW